MQQFKWECIEESLEDSKNDFWQATYRAKVPGGWIVRFEVMHDFHDYSKSKENGYEMINNSLIFITDPNHAWHLEIKAI